MFETMQATIAERDASITLPTWTGLMAGLLGTLTILILVTVTMVILNTNVWAAAHDTLALVLGADYVPNTFQILVGSVIHMLISAALGVVFVKMPCCFPRNFWMAAGLIFGIGTGFIACVLLKPVMMLFGLTGSVNYFLVMWFNVLYGFLYGLAAATYGLEWNFVTRWR